MWLIFYYRYILYIEKLKYGYYEYDEGNFVYEEFYII